MSAESVEILLVEDNPDDIELTLHAFNRHRLARRIHVARDGAEALDFLRCSGAYASRSAHEPPKVILLDLNLPKVDGLDVLRHIKGDPRTRTIPTVVLTASHRDRDLVDSYRLGVNSYIVKPVDFRKFTEAVRALGAYWLLINEPPRG
jgi:two-component system response regulator